GCTLEILHLQIEVGLQLLERTLRVEFDRELARNRRLDPKILKELGQIEILGLEIDLHLSVRRNHRLAGAEIAPGEWQRAISGGVFRRPLADLNLGYFQL